MRFALIERRYRAHLTTLEDHLRVCNLLEKRTTEVEMRLMEGWNKKGRVLKVLVRGCWKRVSIISSSTTYLLM